MPAGFGLGTAILQSRSAVVSRYKWNPMLGYIVVSGSVGVVESSPCVACGSVAAERKCCGHWGGTCSIGGRFGLDSKVVSHVCVCVRGVRVCG